MYRSRLRRPVTVPRIAAQNVQTKDQSYTAGFDTNVSNDDVPANKWRYATDVRELLVGKWDTRQGTDFFSVPIGEAVNVQQTSTTGAATFDFNNSTRWAKKVVATATGPVTSIEANLKTTGTPIGTIVLSLYADSSGAPGTLLFRTTIAGNAVTSTAAYLKGRSITCPSITSGSTYWVTGHMQDGGTGSYQITTTTNASTGLTSSNSGASWSAASLDFNVKISTSTAGGVKGLIRVQRPNGAAYTVFAHGTNLYTVNEITGATTSVDSGIHTSSTAVRFAFVNDVLRYCDGIQKPRKYDFSTASLVSSALETASALIEHRGLIFYLSSADPAKFYWTNFAAYDTFTSTDFNYVPAPKTGDPAVGFSKLNGLLYIHTMSNKYVLYGATNATFRLDNAVGQKGTYSQESITYDENHVYFANKDGIFRFNGAEEKNIAIDILNEWTALTAKENTVLELHNNRLYVWYTPNGASSNSECFVYNLAYGIWESKDLGTYVGRAYSRAETDDIFLVASNQAGMVMLQESDSNDHNNMGEPLTYELRTRYDHYDTHAHLKRATAFRPHFDTADSSYSIQVGYATDYSEDPTYNDVSLAGNGPTFDSGLTFDSGVTFGGVTQINPMDSAPIISGEWRRLQIRYKHEAAREPVSFDGHTIALEVQRML